MSYLCKIPGLGFNYQLMDTIKEHGKNLRSINLLIVGRDDPSIDFNFNTPMIHYIIEGCPSLKTLTLESLRGWQKFETDDLFFNDLWSKASDIAITEKNLKDLYNSCKELKELKLTKVIFEEIDTKDEVEKILPDCNIKIKECLHYVRTPLFLGIYEVNFGKF